MFSSARRRKSLSASLFLDLAHKKPPLFSYLYIRIYPCVVKQKGAILSQGFINAWQLPFSTVKFELDMSFLIFISCLNVILASKNAQALVFSSFYPKTGGWQGHIPLDNRHISTRINCD